MAETTFYSKYDIASLMALINMLKTSLIDQPEVFRTLLAMICDYDPRDTSLRNKIIRYIKLMIKDQMLLKCVLMSLPEGLGGLSAVPRAMPVNSPAPERIFLPQRMPPSPVKWKKLKHGCELNLKPVKLKRLTQPMPRKLLKASATSTAPSEFLPDIQDQLEIPVTIVHSLPYSQHLPSLVRLPAGMAVRPVLPWPPINLIQPSGMRQNLASSVAQNDFMINNVKPGMDLTTNPVKPITRPKTSTDRILTSLSSSLLPTSRGNVAAVEPIRKQHESIKTVTSQSCSSQILQHENVDKSNDIPVRGVTRKTASLHPCNIDTGSLQALAELTSRIGEETKHATDTKIYLGAKKSYSMSSLQMNDDTKKETSAPKARPAILTAGPATGREDGNTMMKSFPYRQEIKLLDGKYFLLNSSADKKILSLKSNKSLSHPTIRQSLQAPLLHDLTAGASHTDPTSHTNRESIKVHTALETNDLPKVGQNSKCNSKNSKTPQTEEMDSAGNTTCAYSTPVSHKNGEEKTCKFHISNSTTNRLITELLRKRALSDCTPSIHSPREKRARAESESQIPDKEGQTGTFCTSVNECGVKNIDTPKTTDDYNRQCVDSENITLGDKKDPSMSTTVTKGEDENISVRNTSANQIKAGENTTDTIADKDMEEAPIKLIQNHLKLAHEMLELKMRSTNLKQSLLKMRINHIRNRRDISEMGEDQSAADTTSSDTDSSDFDDVFYDSDFSSP